MVVPRDSGPFQSIVLQYFACAWGRYLPLCVLQNLSQQFMACHAHPDARRLLQLLSDKPSLVLLAELHVYDRLYLLCLQDPSRQRQHADTEWVRLRRGLLVQPNFAGVHYIDSTFLAEVLSGRVRWSLICAVVPDLHWAHCEGPGHSFLHALLPG